jgi:putative endonuclease
MHHVYVLYSDLLDKYYIGSTADVERRTTQHNSLPEGFTKAGRPWSLVYVEDFESKSEALKREKYLKRMKSRRFIEELIQSKP